MKLRSLYGPVLALALGGGCAKSNDVAPLQAEATALGATYTAQVDNLERRAKELEERAGRVRAAPDVGEAVRLFNEARIKVAELRAMAQRAPAAIAMAAGGATSKPAGSAAGSAASPAEEPSDPKWNLERILDEMKERFTVGITEATAKLDAMESWIYYAERYVAPQPVAPPPEPTAPPANEQPAAPTAPEPPPEPEAGTEPAPTK